MVQSKEVEASEVGVRFAALTDVGNEREGNEDACGSYIESATHVLVAVADGVGGEEGGEIASQTAIDVTLRTYKESPPHWGAAKRLYRAAQQANIEIHDKALVVTELRRMSTTLTAIVVDGHVAHAMHVGDSRLYLVRGGRIVQKTKDHTVAASRRRMLFATAEMAKDRPEHSTLTRSLGRELIAAVDRIAFQVTRDDILLLCSDGLYNVLDDDELLATLSEHDAPSACDALIALANSKGTPDNLSAAVIRVMSGPPIVASAGWRGRLARLLGRE